MTLGDMFTQWQSFGVFSYLLPFLLIFALVFGILTKINIFGTKDNPNRGVNAVIALVVGFLALQLNVVSAFFGVLFPNFAIALSVILIVVIGMGFFIDWDNKLSKWILIGVVLIALVVVLWTPLSTLGFGFITNFILDNLGTILFVLIVLGLMLWVIIGTGKRKTPQGARPLETATP